MFVHSACDPTIATPVPANAVTPFNAPFGPSRNGDCVTIEGMEELHS
jgi:hypothetical protein